MPIEKIVHDLFLLLLKLSQMKEKQQIINAFINELNRMDSGFSVSWSSEKTTGCLEICTENKHFGYISIKGNTAAIDQALHGVMKNAVQMLAVVLEELIRKNELHDEKDRALEKMHHREKEYQMIFENAPVGIFQISPGGTIIKANQRLADMIGLKHPDEIAGKSFEIVSHLHDKGFDEMKKMVDEAGEITGREAEIINPDGSKVVVMKSIRAVRDEKGQVQWYDGILEDITVRYKAETEREKLRRQLWQISKMDAIGQLAGGVAHDFNNILTIIQGNAEMALLQSGEENQIKEMLQEIYSSSERAVNLTRQLLLYSRRQEIELEIININDVIVDLMKMVRRLIGEDIDLRFDLGENLWPVLADKGNIEQVIINLCVNARDAMPGGGRLALTTRNFDVDPVIAGSIPDAEPGRYVYLAVEDSGTGVDETIIDKIFDPFFTTKPVGRGTGMGLAVVQGIVRHHRGWINVYSEKAKGTNFKIYLPATERTESAADENRESLDNYRGRGERVLIVEDDDNVLRYLQRMLTDYGYHIEAAISAPQALEIFIRNKYNFDVLITDVVMPKINGIDLADHLKELKPDIKILITSGYTDDKVNIGHIIEKGYEFIHKPFELAVLLKQLQLMLR